MGGYQLDADDPQVERTNRFGSILIGSLALLLFAGISATSHFASEYLPTERYAGCYLAENYDTLTLSPSGSLRSRGAQVGTFKVLAPVGGKHGPLIEASGLNVVQRNGRVVFMSGSGGFFWDVTDHTLSVIFAPDGTIELQKVSGATCA